MPRSRSNQISLQRRLIVQLHTRLARKFGLVEQPVTLPWTNTLIHMLQPTSFDRLLTAVANDPEQNLPYWATLWPSGVALADFVLDRRAQLEGQPVLELGCGMGSTAIATLAAGANLTVTDYAPETLLLCRANTLRNVGAQPRTLQLNWRKPSAALLDQAPLPLILAADVLYEERDVMPLLALTDRLLTADGMLWLAEPRRPPAERFIAAARLAGWQIETVMHAGPWPDPGDTNVVVRIHLLRRPAA